MEYPHATSQRPCRCLVDYDAIHYPFTRVNGTISRNQVSLHRQWNQMASQAMAEPFFADLQDLVLSRLSCVCSCLNRYSIPALSMIGCGRV